MRRDLLNKASITLSSFYYDCSVLKSPEGDHDYVLAGKNTDLEMFQPLQCKCNAQKFIYM